MPPYEIAPGATEVVACTLELDQPGPFNSQLHLHLDAGGLQQIVLTVRGETQARPFAAAKP